MLLALLPITSGCAEVVTIKTHPPGAAVFVNGKRIGSAPVDYRVAKAEISKPQELRVEKAGFAPLTDTLRTRLAPGRVVAAVFTLGAVYIFRSPWTFHEPEPYLLTGLNEAATSEDRDRALGRSLRLLRNADPNAVIVVPPDQPLGEAPEK